MMMETGKKKLQHEVMQNTVLIRLRPHSFSPDRTVPSLGTLVLCAIGIGFLPHANSRIPMIGSLETTIIHRT